VIDVPSKSHVVSIERERLQLDVVAAAERRVDRECVSGLKRIKPEIVAVQLDEVEGVREYALVSAVVTDEVERGDTVVIAGDSFAVDNAGARGVLSFGPGSPRGFLFTRCVSAAPNRTARPGVGQLVICACRPTRCR
jgi:hypothetical protein